MMLDPATIRPVGTKILCRRYEKPETVRGIIIPELSRQDWTGSLWEPIAFGPKAKDLLQQEIDDVEYIILKTNPWRGMSIGRGTDDKDLFMIEAAEVTNVIRW
jgi:hypothetical protein